MGLPGRPNIAFSLFFNLANKIGLPGLIKTPLKKLDKLNLILFPYLLNSLGVKNEKPFKATLKNNFSKNKKIIRFLKARLTSTISGKLEIEVLKGQESFKIKSFVESNVWGLFKYGQSNFKKGDLIECYSPIGSNINIFK